MQTCPKLLAETLRTREGQVYHTAHGGLTHRFSLNMVASAQAMNEPSDMETAHFNCGPSAGRGAWLSRRIRSTLCWCFARSARP